MSARDRARGWLSSKLMATEGCIERLAGIRNDAVNESAQAGELKRMRAEVGILLYLDGLLSIDVDELLVSLPHIADDLERGESGDWMRASAPIVRETVAVLRRLATSTSSVQIPRDEVGA